MAVDILNQTTQSGDSAPRSAFSRSLRNALFGARLYIYTLTHPLTQEELDRVEHESLLTKLDEAISRGEDAHIEGGRIIVNMAMSENPFTQPGGQAIHDTHDIQVTDVLLTDPYHVARDKPSE